MTIKTVETENEGLKRAFMLTIPAEDIQARVDQEVKRLAPQVRMPGFRPGKVPPNLIRKMHGDSLLGEALNTVVQDGVQQLLTEKNIRPALQPQVELGKDYAPGKDAEVTVRLGDEPEDVERTHPDVRANGERQRGLRAHEGRADVALIPRRGNRRPRRHRL